MNNLTIEDEVKQQAYISQQESIIAQKNAQLSKLETENANLRAALERKEVSAELATAELMDQYRKTAYRMFGDDVVVIDDDAAVQLDPTGAHVAAWVRVTACQAGVDDGSDVVPVDA